MNSQSEDSLAVRAQACLDKGDIVQAGILFEELRSSEPNNADAWLMCGALLGESGSVNDAIAYLETAIQLKPTYPEAHLTMAHLKQADNKIEEAYDHAKLAVDLDASYDEAWVFLGAACIELSYFEEAECACREAISRWPENADAHLNLATALCYLGRHDEAEPMIRQAVNLSGGTLPSVDALLGRVLIGTGAYDEAEGHIKSALNIAPDDITLLINFANIKVGLHEYHEAVNLFRDITNREPESEDAWIGLGSAFQGLYKMKDAEKCYQKAYDLAPSSLPAAYNLALLMQSKGEFHTAINLVEEMLAQYPGQLDLIGCLASNFEQVGEYDRAINAIVQALKQSEKSIQIAKVYQKLCIKLEQCSEAEDYLKATLESVVMNPEERAMLHFCLGELYDKQETYDLAFEQYQYANQYKVENYEHSLYSKYGMPRSGTSLVEKILSSHSAVYGAGELRNIIDLTENFTGFTNVHSTYPTGIEHLAQNDVDMMAGQYIDFITGISSGAERVTDKMPHNFQYIGLIKQLFPNAKIIHCVRDARDTCLSVYFQNFIGFHPYSNDLDDLARHHLDYQRLMQHWGKLEIPMLEVKYEDLIDDQTYWSKKLISYCDLEWEDDCMRFYEKGEQTRTASYDQVRQPIYTKSIARWKNYEKHLAPMLDVFSGNVIL